MGEVAVSGLILLSYFLSFFLCFQPEPRTRERTFRIRVGKLFLSMKFNETQACLFAYILSMVAFMLGWGSWVANADHVAHKA